MRRCVGMSGRKKYKLMPSKRKPQTDLFSSIHIPARGSILSDVEKVPTSNNGKLNPMPKEKSSKKPSHLLPSVVTMLSKSISPGDKQGEATEPLTAPNAKAEAIEPPCTD